MVQHVVLFKWKPESTPQQHEQAKAGLARLPQVIPGITAYSAGNQCSPENLGKGFQFGFVMTFKDAAARDVYLVHAEHKKLVEFLLTILADALVLDYEF